MTTRVVVTGLGTITPIGIGVDSFWKNLVSGISGVDYVKQFTSHNFPVKVAAEIKDFNPKLYIKQRKSLKVMARDIQLCVAAAELCLQDAAIDSHAIDIDRSGICFGAGLIAADDNELGVPLSSSVDQDGKFSLKKFGSTGVSQLFPLWLLKYLPNMLACHTSIIYDFQGPNNTLTTGFTSSSQAIGESYRIIQRGDADMMMCGGAESLVHPLNFVRYHLAGMTSTKSDNPQTISRPFDIDRSGFVIGEAGVVILLEKLEHAQARNAPIYAEIVGYGCASDAYIPEKLHPEGRGLQNALTLSLRDADITPEDVDYLNADGLSTIDGDIIESRAVQSIFDNATPTIPVSSVKGATGNAGAVNGAINFASTVEAVKHNLIPPTINLNKQDPQCNLNLVANKPLQKDINIAVTQNYGLGGQACAIVVKKFR